MWKKIIIIVCIIIFLTSKTFAQIIQEQEATPSIITEIGAHFLITEINYKNSTADWVKMKYFSPTDKKFNIKNISFADDSTFKTITQNVLIESGQELLLTFKSDEQDSIPYLYSTRSGLTGTTEQFIIYDGEGKVLDAVCWTNDKPTEKEIADMEKLYEKEGWISEDIFSCTDSQIVKTNESLIRVFGTDTNSKNDWVTQTETISKKETNNEEENEEKNEEIYFDIKLTELENINTSIETETETEAETLINQIKKQEEAKKEIESKPTNIPLTQIENTNTTKLDETTKETTKKTTKEDNTYKNGNLSEEIVISEIMPNPDGTDTNREWIEIYNKGEKDINLGNWLLDDEEGGSKPYKIPSTITIKAKETYLFESKDAKISLGNGQDEVRIFDYNEKLIDSINYESAPSGQSYSKIKIIDEDDEELHEWIWTPDTTPNKENPTYNQLTITVTKEPIFEESYYFEAETTTKEQIRINFTEDVIPAKLALISFSKGNLVQVLLEKQTEKNDYQLKKYEVIETPTLTKENNNIVYIVILLIIIIAVVIYFLAKKKIPWEDTNKIKPHLNENQKKL